MPGRVEHQLLFMFDMCPYMQINKLWKKLRDALKKPSQYQIDCQQPKAVLLSSGEMFEPYAWAVMPVKLLLKFIKKLYTLVG